MKPLEVAELKNLAKLVRQDILEMIYKAGSGHPAGSLSAVEILVALYFGVMDQRPQDPNWAERDRLVLSAGHICPAQYAVMARAGYFDRKLLGTYAQLGSPLQGHPERVKLPGVEASSGSLGMGLGQAVGMGLAARMKGKTFRVHCLCSDAEHEEGNHWEAVLIAQKRKLSNLTVWVDRNQIQISQTTEEVAGLGSLAEKYQSFGWHALEIDGHDFAAILAGDKKAREFKAGPTVIVAKTVAGKGISFMNDPAWHAKVPSEEEYQKAMEELKR